MAKLPVSFQDAFDAYNQLLDAAGIQDNSLKLYECPVHDLDCPYFKGGLCTIGNPKKECDDYAYYHSEEGNDE